MRLADYRQRHGLTLAQMAKLLKVNEGTVSRYENGRVPESRVMTRILRVCGGEVQPNDFYDVCGDSPAAGPDPETEAA